MDLVVPETQVVYLSAEPTLVLGSSFKSDIFYQFHNQVAKDEGIFYFEHHELFYKSNIDASLKNLRYGDTISIFDLKAMFLKSVLVLWTTEGDLRVAFRDRRGL